MHFRSSFFVPFMFLFLLVWVSCQPEASFKSFDGLKPCKNSQDCLKDSKCKSGFCIHLAKKQENSFTEKAETKEESPATNEPNEARQEQKEELAGESIPPEPNEFKKEQAPSEQKRESFSEPKKQEDSSEPKPKEEYLSKEVPDKTEEKNQPDRTDGSALPDKAHENSSPDKAHENLSPEPPNDSNVTDLPDHHCGNNKCEPSLGETCGTCSQDCTCTSNESCTNSKCVCVKTCSGGIGIQCGNDGCNGSCGTCSTRAQCKKGNCKCMKSVCNHRDKQCTQAGEQQFCLLDKSGCSYWGPPQTCNSGASCSQNKCCTPKCGVGRECGSDGCGGTCGKKPCIHGCEKSKGFCKRRVTVVSIYLDCKHCKDYLSAPDPFIYITFGNGKKHKSWTKTGWRGNWDKKNLCRKNLSYNWTPNESITINNLRKVVVEIRNDHPVAQSCAKATFNLEKLIGQKKFLIKSKGRTFYVTLKVTK